MKNAIQIIKSHPGSVICYALYATFCYMTISSSLKFKAAVNHIEHGDKIAWGEGVMYGYILTFIIAIIFFLIIALNASLRKTGQSFYWWLCLFIVIPLFILIGIS